MSNHEANFFHLLDWSPFVTDIREQHPLLPLGETMALAEENHIKHPTDPRTKFPIVMTTDFLIDERRSGSTTEYARTVKPAKDLCSERVLQKFEIERRYWLRRGVDWGIVTERELPTELVKNIEWIHPYRDVTGKINVSSSEVEKAEVIMAELICQGLPLAGSASACDDRLGLAPGTGLTLVRHFLANRRWSIDMTKLINPQRPVTFLT
ncbi:MAG TPA: TnsA endonuclease N-terminal domain-containing protein [Verrucomicrobiae bacterium]|nr:TnsA endonuclease N-terminal domain-containing protein [Verrucomicrobiae bacterium]